MTDPIFGEVIHCYSRKEAIEDGVLVDVSSTAREVGFRHPVAVTREVWESCCAWTDGDTESTRNPQDESGRLFDVLYMATAAIKGAANRVRPQSTDSLLYFKLVVVPRPGQPLPPSLPGVRLESRDEVILKLHIGGGDNVSATNPDPVMTVMTCQED